MINFTFVCDVRDRIRNVAPEVLIRQWFCMIWAMRNTAQICDMEDFMIRVVFWFLEWARSRGRPLQVYMHGPRSNIRSPSWSFGSESCQFY